MELHLSDNIRTLRKDRGLTQEQLAEALGVSAGAVYKWEAGLSIPDISLLVELADFFDASIDMLLGYAVRDNRQATAVARLKEYFATRDPRGLAEADKALIRYPNCFEVVYQSGALYQMIGTLRQDKQLLQRSVQLLQRAIPLLGQNTDERISESVIWADIAAAHDLMGDVETALSILKRHNVHGANDAIIGMLLAGECNRPVEATPYLSMALLSDMAALMRIAMGYLNVYAKAGQYEEAVALLQMALAHLTALKRPGRPCVADKARALLCACLALMQLHLQDTPAARASLRLAHDIAADFDAAPDYTSSSLRFVALTPPRIVYDDIGTTAIDGVQKLVREEKNPAFTQLWKEVFQA